MGKIQNRTGPKDSSKPARINKKHERPQSHNVSRTNQKWTNKAEKFKILEKRNARNAAKAQQIAEAHAERERIQREKEERIKNYKKKRLERTKIISKRTQRGQPLMKDRMQLLLKQIQEMKRS